MGHPRPLFCLFSSISNKHCNFTTIICKYPSSMWCRDSNPRPSEHESPPITTRPGDRKFCSRSYDHYFGEICDFLKIENRKSYFSCLLDLFKNTKQYCFPGKTITITNAKILNGHTVYCCLN